MSVIEVSHLKKSFGENDVLHDISFSINHGDVISVSVLRARVRARCFVA